MPELGLARLALPGRAAVAGGNQNFDTVVNAVRAFKEGPDSDGLPEEDDLPLKPTALSELEEQVTAENGAYTLEEAVAQLSRRAAADGAAPFPPPRKRPSAQAPLRASAPPRMRPSAQAAAPPSGVRVDKRAG